MMKKTTAILIALAAMLAIFAAVSMNRTAAAQSPSAQGGIWVSGEGEISVSPDLALLDFVVEAEAPTVSEASKKAKAAMDAIVMELKAWGVKDEDIQASGYDIYPIYDSVEETRGFRRGNGYGVSSSATVKLRDLDAVSEVIEDVEWAGGDNVWVFGVRFDLEDPDSKRAELLAMAFKDAQARAEYLAEVSGVGVGKLIHISEDDMISTLVAPGELKLSLSVQAAFAIVDGTVAPTPTPTSEPTAVPTPTATPDPRTDDQKTIDYVERAIARYDRDGRESAFAYYNSQDSLEGERALFVFEPDTFIIWVTLANPAAIGIPLPNHGEPTAFMKAWIAATESGEGWLEYQGTNYRTGQNEPKRGFGKVHDGHIFISSHSNLQQNIGETTKNYVNKAIQYYEDNGRQATIDHYNSRDSLEGYFYLFLMDENDIYLAHPIREDLRGTDIKDVTGKDFDGNYFELGKAIAKADENGIWVEYLWLNPVSGKDEAKTTWAIRHDGLIFASGYYQPLPDEQLPPWIDADPRKYTEDYVNRAIARYERDGLQAMKDYYNSVASYEGEWYLFATDANDIYHVHPLVPRLIGTDIKDVVGKDINGNPGFELGKELAKAGEGQGVWVEYLWPHPATTKEAKKVSYAVRKDGMLFATGYYPAPKDKPAHVRNFVQGAIDVYKSDGLDGVKNLYGKGENSDGLWFLQVLDENAVYVVHGSVPSFVGIDANTLPLPPDLDGNPLVPQVLAATEDGVWINIPWPAVNGPENLIAHLWVVKHDGYFFGAAYYDSLSYVRTRDRITEDYVKKAIKYYEDNGQAATAARYNSLDSIEGERYMVLMKPAGDNLVTLLTYPLRPTASGATIPYPPISLIVAAGDEGYWFEGQKAVNPLSGKEEPGRAFGVLHDGLVFVSAHYILRDNLEAATKNYVNKAIKYYDDNGQDATVAHYNSRDSLDGQFYLFLMDENDIYLAHPIFPHLIGTDIKDLPNKDVAGNPLGKEIVKATAAGHWVEYLWPHPTTREEERKFTWVKRYKGLIFASGYYEGGDDGDGTPLACKTAPQQEYTIDYVNRAIKRYEEDGLQAMKDYYNSVASYECEWYLFSTDANDIYHVHPLVPRLIGTDIKDVVGKDIDGNPGYELGKALAAAVAGGEGVWVEYQWPHPATGKDAPKRAYAKRHEDGTLFASGFYPVTDDPEGFTMGYVGAAIKYYNTNGREAAFEYYNSEDSFEGQWYLIVTDESGIIRVNPVFPDLIGKTAPSVPGFLAAIDAGEWYELPWDAPGATGEVIRRAWGLKHDGHYFWSGYFVER